MTATQPTRSQHDLPTLLAIAVVAYGLANIGHEGIGHGGACLLAGGRPEVLSSVHFECDEASLSMAGRKLLAAGGTVVNVVIGAVVVAWQFRFRGTVHLRFFGWLLATINLLQAAGYLMFSGIGNIGDWAVVVSGLGVPWAWRGSLAIGGALAYALLTRAAAFELAILVGREDRIARLRALAVPAYFAGGALYCVSGLLNPLGPLLVLISAAAASFGGTSGLMWFHEWLRRDRTLDDLPDGATRESFVLRRHPGWLAAGGAMAIVFVAVLGRGIRF